MPLHKNGPRPETRRLSPEQILQKKQQAVRDNAKYTNTAPPPEKETNKHLKITFISFFSDDGLVFFTHKTGKIYYSPYIPAENGQPRTSIDLLLTKEVFDAMKRRFSIFPNSQATYSDVCEIDGHPWVIGVTIEANTQALRKVLSEYTAQTQQTNFEFNQQFVASNKTYVTSFVKNEEEISGIQFNNAIYTLPSYAEVNALQVNQNIYQINMIIPKRLISLLDPQLAQTLTIYHIEKAPEIVLVSYTGTPDTCAYIRGTLVYKQ